MANEDISIPESWKNPGHDNVTMRDYPAIKSIRNDVMNDPWGFCHFIVKNMIARTPLPSWNRSLYPMFTDHLNIASNRSGYQQYRTPEVYYNQWLNCLIDYEDEEHPTCKKARWYFEFFSHPRFVEQFDDDRVAGGTAAIYIRQKLRNSGAVYQPFKIHQPGLYEWRFALGHTFKEPADLGFAFELDKLSALPSDVYDQVHLG
eukprot:TRINITY_DN13490_c0_g1_i1.p2 TRINITY_DN13490_c0_g1~~TRINITY_DN13490_c0_g1_i1.p2  ORF type:complete len:203 (+),score=42.33 TRINITY_DN13490_c0_g1_i1:118-726(+)